MPNLGPTELIIVLVLVIIVFGAGKLPEVGGALGKSIKEFRKASDDPAEIKAKEDAAAAAEAERRQREDEVKREVERRQREEEIKLEVEKRLAQERETARKE